MKVPSLGAWIPAIKSLKASRFSPSLLGMKRSMISEGSKNAGFRVFLAHKASTQYKALHPNKNKPKLLFSKEKKLKRPINKKTPLIKYMALKVVANALTLPLT